MWSWRDGKRLAQARLHGPVQHLLVEGDRAYALSALGQNLTWDLKPLYVDRCTLLRSIWKEVPVVWRDGRPVFSLAPKGHPCLATDEP